MLIGILQTGQAPDVLIEKSGDYPDMFERLLAGYGFAFRSFRVVDGEFPADVQACDGWLITGSRHGAYEDHAWIPPLEAFIRDAYAAHVPLVGICFGHQIIAQGRQDRTEGLRENDMAKALPARQAQRLGRLDLPRINRSKPGPKHLGQKG